MVKGQKVSGHGKVEVTGKAVVAAAKSITDQEYASLIEEIKDILTEHVFQSRWLLLQGYHQIGKVVAEAQNRVLARYGAGFMKKMADETGIRERELYNAVKFYKKWPDMNTIPEGKNASWSKIRNEYLLDEPKEKEEHTKCICPTCGASHNEKKEKD